MNDSWKSYRRDCWLAALSAALMLVGDLCLSVIPAAPADSGLFMREAYLSGMYPAWRLPVLLATGILGMALAFFTVRASYTQIRPQYRKTRLCVLVGGVIYVASAGMIHLLIGSLADWTSTLSQVLGREETAALIQEKYDRLMPAMLPAYAGMFLLILSSAFAVLTRETILPRRMFVFHMLTWQIIFVLIPDIRQLLVNLSVMNLIDRFLVDGWWVGHTRAWTIPGTEDLKPYITAADKRRKWLFGTAGMVVISAILSDVMTIFVR